MLIKYKGLTVMLRELIRKFTEKITTGVRRSRPEYYNEIKIRRCLSGHESACLLEIEDGIGSILHRSSNVPEIDRLIVFCNDLCHENKLKPNSWRLLFSGIRDSISVYTNTHGTVIKILVTSKND